MKKRIVLALGALGVLGWLATAQTQGAKEAGAEESEPKPLESFKTSEEIGVDNALSFPVDI